MWQPRWFSSNLKMVQFFLTECAGWCDPIVRPWPRTCPTARHGTLPWPEWVGLDSMGLCWSNCPTAAGDGPGDSIILWLVVPHGFGGHARYPVFFLFYFSFLRFCKSSCLWENCKIALTANGMAAGVTVISSGDFLRK